MEFTEVELPIYSPKFRFSFKYWKWLDTRIWEENQKHLQERQRSWLILIKMNCLKIEAKNYRTFNCDLNVFLDNFNSVLLKNRIKKIDKNNWLKKV